jgi:hypothetical protein
MEVKTESEYITSTKTNEEVMDEIKELETKLQNRRVRRKRKIYQNHYHRNQEEDPDLNGDIDLMVLMMVVH